MSALTHVLELCAELQRHRIVYQLMVDRTEALMIVVAVPGERWEIEFFDDGHIEVEKFVSRGVEDGEHILSELLSYYE